MNTQKNILAVEIGIHDNKELFHEFYAEKDKIEAEKAENAKMLEELKALKAQLEAAKSDSTEDSSAEVMTENTTEL